MNDDFFVDGSSSCTSNVFMSVNRTIYCDFHGNRDFNKLKSSLRMLCQRVGKFFVSNTNLCDAFFLIAGLLSG